MSLEAGLINVTTFQSVLARYEKTIPEKLKDLESFRGKLPGIVQSRMTKTGEKCLEKAELERLVEWKLKHGTFRPKLLSLVSSNSASDIRLSTQSGFEAYSTDGSLKAALNHITKLKGVGPATASLVLSAWDPANAIFFGDEVFRWICWDEPLKESGGWDRKIGYTAKEYVLLAEKAGEVMKRLGVTALELEMVGYVLGKEHADIEAYIVEEEGEAELQVKKTKPSKPQSGKKRSSKAAMIDEPFTAKPKRKKT